MRCEGVGVQDVTNEKLDALSCLVSLREFLLTSTSGSKGEGLASLQYLPHLQVDLYPYVF